MRKYKFRVWDKKKKIMLHQPQNDLVIIGNEFENPELLEQIQ